MSSVHSFSRLRTSGSGAPATSAKSCPALNTGPSPASTMPAASLSPASVTAASSWVRCSRDSAFRFAAPRHRDADDVAVPLDPRCAIGHGPTLATANADPDAGSRMEPVRFGLVGYGFGGRYFHAPLLAAARRSSSSGS